MSVDPQKLREMAYEQENEHAVVLLDPHQRIVSWAGAATRMFGYTEEEMLGATLERLFTPEDRERGEVENEYRTALSHGRADDDRWLVRRDEMRIWVSGALMTVKTADGQVAGFSKIFRDRTEVRGQIDTMRNRLEAALHADAQKSIFIGTLAHELRNPLGPLMNAAQLIRLSLGDRPDAAYPLKIIERQVRFIESLVAELLDLTRVGTGKLTLNVSTIDLGQVIDDALETCSTQVAEKNHRVEVLMPDAIMLEADPQRLQQVLINLIGNSVKFSPPGRRIWVKATVEGDDATVRIEDEGNGIPSDLLPHIFDLFTQASNPVQQRGKSGGLGLGLSLVKSFVELHHGTVQARSEGVGQGAEFTVRLPLRQPAFSRSGMTPGPHTGK